MDNTDKELISILRKDGRTSLSDMGKELGMSHVAVRKRLDKLVSDNKLLRIGAEVNSESLDMKLLFIALETENIDITEKLINKYKDCPRLVMLAPVTGRYNLFAVMVAEDTFSLESILGTCSIRTEDGIRRSETWFGNSPMIPQYLPLDLSPPGEDSHSPCGQVCKDCRRFKAEKCVGCPTSEVYRGTVWASDLTPGRRRKKRKS